MSKILVLTHEYWPYRGGVARYLYNLFSGLPTDQYLVLTDSKASLGPNVRLIKFKYGFIRPTWLPAISKLRQIIRQEKIDLLFTPNILPLGSLAYFMYLLWKVPYVISLHGLDIRLAIGKKKWLAKLILDNAKQIVVNSENTAGQLQKLKIDKSKVVLIYPNIEVREAIPEITKKIKADLNLSGKKVILTVGRLVRRKGHHLILKALSEMDTTDLKYISVGNGPELENLRKLRGQLGLEGKVKFAYDVSEEALASYYECADIFVLPNILSGDDVEGFGIVFLEAASFGLPIIGGRNGGVTEILSDDNAKLIDTSDYLSVKKALLELLNDPSQAAKLAAGAKKAAIKFEDIASARNKLKSVL